MTDKHDKLVALLRECGAEEAVTGLFYVTAKDIAAFAAAHVASLCADVEPVAFMFQHSETGRIAFVDAWQKENGWALANPRYSEVGTMHGASTVASLTAQRDQALARVAELEKDAARYRWLRDAPATSASEPIRHWMWSRPYGANMKYLDDAIDQAMKEKGDE